MPEISLNDLDPRLQKQLQGAEQSIARGNPAYAIDVCMGILKSQPGCLDVRKVLRTAQRRLADTRGKHSRMFSGVTNAPFMLRGGSQVKKDPVTAMETAEKMLKNNPASIPGLRLLGQAAMAARFPLTAVFAFEGIREIDRANVDNLFDLGEAYLAKGDTESAVIAGEQILKLKPGDGEAAELIRRASVSQTIEKGHWEREETDFREKLRDEEKAMFLEQQSRYVHDEESLQGLIKEVYEKIQQEPDNINFYREIAGYYRKLKDYDSAIEWIGYARSRPTGAADTTLESLQAEIRVEQMEKAIAETEKQLADDPDNADLVEAIRLHKEELHQYRYAQAKERVEKYPNDYTYRFDFGKLCYEAGQQEAAIQQFQLSQRSPKVRPASLLYMGMAFKAGGKYDLAVQQLRTLRDELVIMDNTKKSAIYELGEAYEHLGRREEAIEEYKTLYQYDIAYRDVADKINRYYESRGSNA